MNDLILLIVGQLGVEQPVTNVAATCIPIVALKYTLIILLIFCSPSIYNNNHNIIEKINNATFLKW